MTEFLKALAWILAVLGIGYGIYVGSVFDEFSFRLAAPYFITGIALLGLFLGLSHILEHVIAIRSKLVGDIQKKVLTADGYEVVDKSE